MNYSKEEVIQYVKEEDVKFIRLAFCDVFGKQKNIAIMPEELPGAFESGVPFDASAIAGFGEDNHSDLLLHPEPETLSPLPWRPEHGRVIQMFSKITHMDGSPFPCDTRSLLVRAVEDAEKAGYRFTFGAEQEFYLFKMDENGEVTGEPCDRAGYMDVAPEDRGENVRREICLTLEKMGVRPQSSHHEEGPGQNMIDFRFTDAVRAADNAMTFQRVVKTVAFRNGVAVDLSPKPLENTPGNGFHINLSVEALNNESPNNDETLLQYAIAGILENVRGMTAFLNPTEESYKRLGRHKAPGYVTWSRQNRSQLIRVPAAVGMRRRAELRSPDPEANPYLALTLLIYAGLYGIKRQLDPGEPVDVNFSGESAEVPGSCMKLPESCQEARRIAENDVFINEHIPAEILKIYCNRVG